MTPGIPNDPAWGGRWTSLCQGAVLVEPGRNREHSSHTWTIQDEMVRSNIVQVHLAVALCERLLEIDTTSQTPPSRVAQQLDSL